MFFLTKTNHISYDANWISKTSVNRGKNGKKSKYINMNDSIFEYRKATIEDIDELVRTRIIVLRAVNKLSYDVDMSVVEKESNAYYKRALENGEHIAYLV